MTSTLLLLDKNSRGYLLLTDMHLNIKFENHYNVRVMEILFPEGCILQNQNQLRYLKTKWQENLKSWHTPYTCIFDFHNFNVRKDCENDFVKLLHFFEKFHMKKIIGFKDEHSILPEGIFFQVFPSYEFARKQTGLAKDSPLLRNVENLRERIQIENDFHAHVIEMSFLSETILETRTDILIVKAKLQNILRLWHTPYSLLLNCSNLKFSTPAKESFLNVEKFLKGFFCMEIIGYSPCDNKENYPFQTFRSRHIAAGRLESLGAQSGEEANCNSKKNKTPLLA